MSKTNFKCTTKLLDLGHFAFSSQAAADVGLRSRKMPRIALVSPRQHQLCKITTERRQLWRLLRRSMAVFSWQHGVAAAAEAFGVGKHVVHYWRRKLTNLTFHPKLCSGAWSACIQLVQCKTKSTICKPLVVCLSRGILSCESSTTGGGAGRNQQCSTSRTIHQKTSNTTQNG